MGLESIGQVDIAPSPVVVDIDQVGNYYPTLACVTRGRAYADDTAFIETRQIDNGEMAVMFRFASEVFGKGSLFGIPNGLFSDYAVFVTENGKLFATKMRTEQSGESVPDMSVKYALSPIDRVSLILAQALDCYAFSLAENQDYTDFATINSLAIYLEQNSDKLMTEGLASQAATRECEPWQMGCVDAPIPFLMTESFIQPYYDI